MEEEKKAKKPVYKKWWFWVIIVLVVIIGVGGTGKKDNNTKQTSSQETQKQEEILEVDYKVLYQEYQDNAINADSKYRDKILKLTGAVDNINREIAGNPYITFKVGDKNSFKDVRITFKKSEEEKVANLKKGQTVTIKGKCSGQLATGTVSLNDCEIIE